MRAVGTWTLNPDTQLDIRVYTDLSDANNPKSGTLALGQREPVANSGWYTIDLDTPITIEPETRYSVVVSMVWGDNSIYLPMEVNQAFISYQICIDPGESFMKTSINGEPVWADVCDVSNVIPSISERYGNVCVKAYADAIPSENPDQNPDQGNNPGTGDDTWLAIVDVSCSAAGALVAASVTMRRQCIQAHRKR